MRRIVFASASALVACFAFAQTAAAQDEASPVIVQQAPPPATVQQPVMAAPATSDTHMEETSAPNRGLIVSGALMLGIPYAASVIVAAESPHFGDSHLYVPIVGPWLDLGDRGGCPVGNVSCDTETTNKVLLVGDGVLQALGALEIVGGFLFPERHVNSHSRAAKLEKPTLKITPSRLAPGAYGVTALGTF